MRTGRNDDDILTGFIIFVEKIAYYDTGKGNREVLRDTEGAERN